MQKKLRLAYIILAITISIILTSTIISQNQVKGNPGTILAITKDKNEYCLREKVKIQGTLSSDGTPISNGLIAIEIMHSTNPIMFRTIPTGNITSVSTLIEIVGILPCDSSYKDKEEVFYIQPYPAHSYAYFKLCYRNKDTNFQSGLLTVTLCDGNAIPIQTSYAKLTMPPGENIWPIKLEIPYWAYIGTAKLYANIYTDYPHSGGVPHCPEKSVYLKLTRNQEFLQFQPEFPEEPPTIEPEGTINATFRLSPEPIPGSYTVYATARTATILTTIASGETTFNVNPTFSINNGYPPSAPQASFTYIPLHPYKNAPILFDASASSAEGFEDTIVKYEWNWGDGQTSVTTSTTIYHTFAENTTYIVTLNVTDSEGLWCITSKPVTVYPPDPPKASFTWLTQPVANQTTTFDASQSQPGWNGTHAIPIVSYRWDFGDGNITTVSVNKINHTYTLAGNYTVTLTVTDSSGLNDTTSKLVNVLATAPPALIGDVNRDGVVDAQDYQLVKRAIPSTPGDPKWNPNADLNNDGIIDATDFQIVKIHIGEHA
jgi:PKD repeat protein